jgi:geranylgeranyl diphosphate synthase type II
MAAYQLKTPTLVRDLMGEYGELTRAALLRFLPHREPRRYLYDVVGEYPRRKGRYMRPAICIASAKAHGATAEQALHCAVSIELLHNALLVVDDIEDESEERRGLPTLHKTHGVPVALNAGTTMSILSLVPLLRNVDVCGPHIALWIFERMIEVAQHAAEGQAMELGWRLDNRVDVDPLEYFDMVLRKTCSYSTIFPIRLGAIIGLQRADVPDAVLRYGFLVGAAFQIQDDLLNLYGDHERYGKELRGDLLEGKRTLLTIRLLERCTPGERAFVERFLGKSRADKTDDEVDTIVAWMERYGCGEHARQMAQGLIGAAQHAFSQSLERLPPSRDKEFLRGLSTWIVEQI